ncbi:DNA polymerase zeta catalytic subunit, putative [Talaromyces stipitatus ATCC 10500]|uniref:DNA polymerase n=1 Tax=Talaromyces stipitatus (strain ATCC 10500 / CBS 375.48 / QM 6759 / NRRL 1006) TaxID=441959 RepID=B8MMT3_TALSN|nr:DNA polymerase zeta catalytic subunit, putative [Talaromyces stipitatus ATCC 10500]EED13839.1 DNA polymerase zeta catalytic subunit, putative [Talaromyces stipitatus ATCC 10500]
MDTFRVRLNCIDDYQAVPTEFDPPVPFAAGASQRTARPKVPVIRAFGATETGQKVCVHIHGAFPYLYIEYRGGLGQDEVNDAIRNLHKSIDHALANSYRHNAYDGRVAYVAHISLVKGIPFYGYHVGYRYYLKIYLLNPLNIIRLADLLRQGAVMKYPLQPYESHLQFIPQWMCDYNLYGCAYMDCAKAKFRSPVPEYLELSNLDHRWHDRTIPPEYITSEAVLPKQSHCTLEVDVCVQDILNRKVIKERPLHHDFIERKHPISAEEKLVHSMAGLWQDETHRRKKRLGIKDPSSSPFAVEELVSMSASPRDQNKAAWIHEEEFRDHLLRIVEEEKNGRNETISFDNYVKHDTMEDMVQSALESVEDLYPQKLEPLMTQVAQSDGDQAAVTNAYHTTIFSDGFQVDDEWENEYSNPEDGYDKEDGLSSSSFQIDDELLDAFAEEINGIDDTRRKYEKGKIDSEDSRLGYSASKRGQADDTISPEERVRKRPKNEYGDSSKDESKSKRADDSFSSFDVASILQEKDEECERGGPNETPPDHPQIGLDSSQKAVWAGQNQRLSFPVVKDPNDPMTVSRFSQRSGLSKEHSQLSQVSVDFDIRESNGVEKPFSEPTLESSSNSTVAHTHMPSNMTGVYQAFDIPANRKILFYRFPCPTARDVKASIEDEGRPAVVYQKPFYSDDNDVPERSREYAGREFRLVSDSIRYLPHFELKGTNTHLFAENLPPIPSPDEQRKEDRRLRELSLAQIWEFAQLPPTRNEVVEWFEKEEKAQEKEAVTPRIRLQLTKSNVMSQIEGATQKNPYGFKYSQKQQSTSVVHQTQYMSVMSLEVHVNTRESLAPNPEEDEISCVFWSLRSDDEDVDVNSHLEGVHLGILAQPADVLVPVAASLSIEVQTEASELDLITSLVDIVRSHDPDIITGYEVHNSSWGYLIERARVKYEYDLCNELSRVKTSAHGRFGKDSDRWGFNHTSSISVTGRHMINIWRAMRSELTLLGYTMENVVFHLLHRRIPHYPFRELTRWFTGSKPRDMMKVMEYYLSRVQLDLEILDTNELIPRTSEQARLLGVDFFSVFSRGSQFKVESLMFRIAKPENFMLVTPSRKQVGQQNALECLPLVMEPQSDFYTSPLLVLDFQSLYPSIIIAYNYCYSTFLGRLDNWRGRGKMGFMEYERQERILELLKDHVNIAPNGMIYAKPEIRKSLLARMLSEILETRVMVKSGMKADKDDKTLQQLLNHRQLALKMIANVTYGYTSASFSGRMPCSEIADSIVQTARETLERTIAFIHSVDQWDAEVVYGDTDSLFISLKGRTRDEAFTIGEEISKAVTKMNPRPVKLKFEKLYHPCVLLAKKRYVGFKYEHRDQVEPEFDAKGIETVRRDGTPAEQKIEEKALKILFRTADLSRVKSYFQKQCLKIMQGRISVQDFCFAREVRLGTYSEKGTLPAGALISTKKMLEDPRLEPQYGERVPYVVVTGAPGARLIDRCVAPEVLLNNAHLELDAEYYITKNLIPPLERIFNLVGANVRQWYDEMPKIQRIRRIEGAFTGQGDNNNSSNTTISKKTLESYMKSSICLICKNKLTDKNSDLPLCNNCTSQSHVSLFKLTSQLQQAERRTSNLLKICRSCMVVPFGDDVICDSKDCPVFYSRTREMSNWKSSTSVLEPVVRELERRDGQALDW